MLDLAAGRLRLDRLCRNGAVQTFFPCGCAAFLARQESLPAAILRYAAAQAGASSIACGLSIRIEAAMVAGSKHSKET